MRRLTINEVEMRINIKTVCVKGILADFYKLIKKNPFDQIK